MAETMERGPMYEPWTRVDRPRRRVQRCRIIRKQGSSSGNPGVQKKRTWKDLMKKKQERERGRHEGWKQKEEPSREGTKPMEKRGKAGQDRKRKVQGRKELSKKGGRKVGKQKCRREQDRIIWK